MSIGRRTTREGVGASRCARKGRQGIFIPILIQHFARDKRSMRRAELCQSRRIGDDFFTFLAYFLLERKEEFEFS